EPFDAGLRVDFDGGAMIEGIRSNSPAENAGIQSGDELVELAGRRVGRNTWLTTLARYKSGDSVPITVKRNRQTIKTQLVLGQPDRVEFKIEERPAATAEQKKLRAAWLSGS
ncbi:MAG: hypothetical protein DMF69_02440, partial [Acidobacteria bacterium]